MRVELVERPSHVELKRLLLELLDEETPKTVRELQEMIEKRGLLISSQYLRRILRELGREGKALHLPCKGWVRAAKAKAE